MLTPPQQTIIDSGLLSTGFNCVVQMPTGSGKTWLAEYAIREAMTMGHRCIYLTPLRALADELTARWNQALAPFPVGVFRMEITERPTSLYPCPMKRLGCSL